MSGNKSSAVAAVAGELGCSTGHTPAAGAAEIQADLLRDFEDEIEAFSSNAIAPPPRRAGRPVGSRNRSTAELKAYLSAKGYRDPAEFLASIYSADAKKLATSLGCETLEAAKLQAQAATAALPYFHQKLPQEIALAPTVARPLVMIVEGGASVRQVGGGATMSVNDPQEYQGVSIDAE